MIWEELDDVEKSYSTHFWHPTTKFAKMITPKTIQIIDSPVFCRIRNVFDNLDDGGYYSIPPEKKANCSVTWTSDLKSENHRMFSDYRMSTDDLDITWVDSSGFSNHGWAPKGTLLHQNSTSGLAIRNITANSYTVLPVPADWDSRVWSVWMTFHMDTKKIAEGMAWDYSRSGWRMEERFLYGSGTTIHSRYNNETGMVG